jgi:hypothetical protein
MIDDRRWPEYAVPLCRKGACKRPMPEDPSGQITELLHQWTQGDEKALSALAPLVYKELRRLAHHHLQSELSAPTQSSSNSSPN